MSNSISCESINAKLDAFHDNELTPGERLELEAHIAACAACAKYLADVDAVKSSLRSLPMLTPKVDVAANFEQILAARGGKQKVVRLPVIWSGIGVAAAAAIALFVGRGFVNPNATIVGSALTPHSVNSTIASTPDAATKTLMASNKLSQLPTPSAVQKTEKGEPIGEKPKLANNQPDKKTKLDESVNRQLEVQEVAHSIGSQRSNMEANKDAQEQSLLATNQTSLNKTQSGSGRGSMDGSGADEIASNQSPQDLGTGAIGQISSVPGKNVSAAANGGRNLVAVYDAEQQNNTSEELGIATDEDGLYAIKL
jgi:hypothetical protein